MMNGFGRMGCYCRSVACWVVGGVFLFFAGGCIERTVSINTEPPAASVFLNDQEVGKSPVRVPFTWYGDYDIVIRKPGHKTIHTNHRIRTPWYQYPLIDIVAECMVPFTIHDDRVLETYVLDAYEAPEKEVLLGRAEEMRGLAVPVDVP